jgi:hypothetical protein
MSAMKDFFKSFNKVVSSLISSLKSQAELLRQSQPPQAKLCMSALLDAKICI